MCTQSCLALQTFDCIQVLIQIVKQIKLYRANKYFDTFITEKVGRGATNLNNGMSNDNMLA